MNIEIRVGTVTLNAVLNNTPTAKKIAGVLPLSCPFHTWGNEIYFTIPVEAGLEEDAREEVEIGLLGYWPAGSAFCIFFGPTPMSRDGKIIPASPVNVIGKVTDDAARLKAVMGESTVEIMPVSK